MKIAINACFGGFSLSRKALARLAHLQGRECHHFSHEIGGRYAPADEGSARFPNFSFDIPNPNEAVAGNSEAYARHAIQEPIDRSDPLLVQTIEEMGDEASGTYARVRIVEIPDGVDWEIEEHDGLETIHEKHRSWS